MGSEAFTTLMTQAASYQTSCILAAAAELDLFTPILEHGGSLGAMEVAAARGCDPKGAECLLDALAALAYLYKSGSGDNARYSVAPDFADMLDSRHPASFIPMLRHMANGQRLWVQIAARVKDGVEPQRNPSILGVEEDKRSFIMGMGSIACHEAKEVTRVLSRAGVLPSSGESFSFIDVGGGSGSYAQAFLEAMPGSRGAVFDLPTGIAEARKRFAGTSTSERVELHTGDFYTDELPSGFDLAWISAVIHQHERKESRALYRKCFAALNPGGMLAVRDFIMNEARTFPCSGALFGVNMYIHYQGKGRVYTFDEVREDMETAGFRDVTLAVPSDSMSAVVTSHKP